MIKVTNLFLYFVFFTAWPQTSSLDTFFYLSKNQAYEQATEVAHRLQDEDLRASVLNLCELMASRKGQTQVRPSPKDSDALKFVKLLALGYENQYAQQRNSLEAYKRFSQALKLSDRLENVAFTKAALLALLDLFDSEIFIGSRQYEPFLERFENLKSDLTDEALIVIYNLIFFSKTEDDVNQVDAQYYTYLGKLDSIFAQIPQSNALYAKYFFEKGIYYKIEDDFDKAEEFFIKSDSIASLHTGLEHLRPVNSWQIAAVHFQKNDLETAKKYIEIAQSVSLKLKDSFYITRLKSLIFNKEGRTDSAYYYLRKSVDIEYRLGYKNNTLESSILTVQNQTDKLKLDKLELDAENRKNRNWATALGLLLVVGTALGLLIHSNTKRKQLLAEQGKTLQEQKVATLLKEQELTSIDAMIEGQEKERQRIANDLHDDLGGLMATVKLHFDSLHARVKDDTDELYTKTNKLIDEAYQKIRAIAHAKNSGVIAKQGLLKAVEQMAEKVSLANNITIEVKDFGLDNRMENSLELTLFRIIQELIANIIKHAKASRVNIHLTNHGDTLNILVEDNGIGFKDTKSIAQSDGMGLKSIDKRVAHLEGTLHIESEPNKGATVIIDIPI